MLMEKAHNCSFSLLLFFILGVEAGYELFVVLLLFFWIELLLQLVEDLEVN